jgi:hypothetical protein
MALLDLRSLVEAAAGGAAVGTGAIASTASITGDQKAALALVAAAASDSAVSGEQRLAITVSAAAASDSTVSASAMAMVVGAATADSSCSAEAVSTFAAAVTGAAAAYSSASADGIGAVAIVGTGEAAAASSASGEGLIVPPAGTLLPGGQQWAVTQPPRELQVHFIDAPFIESRAMVFWPIVEPIVRDPDERRREEEILAGMF